MYIVFEYLTYLTLVALFGLALFTVAATLLVTRAGARMAASLARRAASHLAALTNKPVGVLSSLSLQRSHQEQ